GGLVDAERGSIAQRDAGAPQLADEPLVCLPCVDPRPLRADAVRERIDRSGSFQFHDLIDHVLPLDAAGETAEGSDGIHCRLLRLPAYDRSPGAGVSSNPGGRSPVLPNLLSEGAAA